MKRMRAIVSASLLLTVLGAAPAQAEDGRYIVKFRDASHGKAALRGAGAAVLLELGEQNAAAALIPPRALEALRSNPNIERIEVDQRRYPMAQTTPYGIPMVQADQLSDMGAAGRRICIIDSGYSLAHADLDDDSSVSGDNDSGTGNWFVDNCAHGTHVAGTISALNNGIGVLGVLPNGNINLHIVKVFGDNCAWTYSSSLVSALNKCRDAGANVVSMSLGGGSPSQTENNAFQDAYNAGVLSIAAAGNGGNTQTSYPAGYASVVSVAAVDSAKALGSFSQRNSDVELSAPGVAVRSTVTPGTGSNESATVAGASYEVTAMDGAPDGTGSGSLVDCGLGTSDCAGAAGNVCLIERGTISFDEKVRNCQDGGGVAAIIFNNAASLFVGTLGTAPTSSIPAVGLSGTDGQFLRANELGTPASVTTQSGGDYSFFDGTSMATPHVSGVAALVWSYFPTCSNDNIRTALQQTAEDLGSAGRDNSFGYGLVRAKSAYELLTANGCGGGGGCTPTGTTEVSCSDGIDNDCDGLVDGDDPDCQTSCLPRDAACSTNDECCSGSCKGKPGRKTCK